MRPCLFDVQRRRIYQMHMIAFFGEREGINPSGAAHVADYRGRRWQIAMENVCGAQPFHLARVAPKSLLFLSLGIVAFDFFIQTGEFGHVVVVAGHKSPFR